MRSYLVVGLCVALATLCLTTPLSAQRSDRGIITGIVTDTTGSAIAGADVKVRNEGTAVETTLVTNNAGAYTTPPLVLGTYTVSVDHAGFKKAVSTGIQLQGAESIRQDVILTVGAVTESVEVKAEAELNVTTPDISHVVDEKYYQDIPTITAADVRLAEAVLQIQPGYLPMKPNGDPMFRGSQFNSRINGGQSMATENFFDGAAFGYAVGHQQSQESAPPIESIKEVKVITTSFSAQYGHTSGGFIEYTSKPGTNTLHGSAYEFFANDALNARGFFDADCDATGHCVPRKKTPLKNNSFGFTLGGPVVIPHIYDGHSKTFFFTNFDWTRLRSGVLPGFGNTTPIDAFKAGDFSSWPDQIYNPYSTTVTGGIPTRDPFVCDGAGNPIVPNLAGGPGTPGYGLQAGGTPCNKLPSQLFSTVASRVAALMVHPDRAGFNNNVAGNPAGDQTWLLNARTIEFRVDHSFTPNFRMSESFYWGHRPSIRNCGEVAGCTTQFNGETEPQKNTSYYGNGFYQRIATHHTHTQFDWIIRPNLLNHTTIAWDRWFMGGNPLSAGAGWPGILWAGTPGETLQPQGVGGLLDQTAGPPLLDFAGNIPYNSLGQYGWGKFGFLTNNRWQFSDDLSWVKGKHTIKVGFEYRWHQFPFSGWANGNQAGEFRFDRRETGGYDSTGNLIANSGESFASFLLGQVDSSTQNIPFHPMFYEAYTSPWINDEYKVNSRLTLTLGLRFDYEFARTETQDRYSTFDPNTPNPGAGGLPGALLFAGKGAGRTGSRTFEHPAHDAWGPRLGFAYRVNDKTAIRGGYGIYYSGISFDQFIGQPTIGYVANPTVGNISNGQFSAFSLDNGFPATNKACPGGTDTSPCITPPPFIDPSFANNTSPIAVAKNGLTLPRYQNWSLTFERQLNDNLRLDVSYIANRGTRLTADWQKMGVAANMNSSSVLSIPHDTLTANCSSASLLPSGNCAGEVPLPYSTFNGSVAQALRKFPQYQNVLWRDVPIGSSMYNALEVVLEQRYSHGLGFRVGYTYSKLHNDGSETGQGGDGANGAVQDPSCPHVCEWGLSRDETPHVFLVGFTWEVPFGKGLSSRAGRFALGGWNLAGALRYESGRPMNITMDNPLGGLLFNGQRRPNRVKGVSAVKRGSNFNPLTDNYFNPAAWSDPGVQPDPNDNPILGNAPRRDGSVRAFPTYNEDINIFKVFPIKERLNLRFEAQFGNIFNRTDFCDPNGFYGPASFGTVNTQCNQPRSIQFGLRLNY